MSYSDFTLGKVADQFGLRVVERDIYGQVATVPLSPPSRTLLIRNRPLTRVMGTEKARSEFLIAPILAEAWFLLDDQISLFSGIELPAAPEQGLSGVCDFLFSRSPQQLFLTRPIIAVVEAKNENISTGFGQCIAEMIGARIFNEKKQISEPTMFGVVTTGTLWRFLRMEGNDVIMDATDFEFKEIERVLGVLISMLGPAAGSTGN